MRVSLSRQVFPQTAPTRPRPSVTVLLLMNLITSYRRREKKGSAGRTVPLQQAEKISLSDNSGGQFQTTQNDKGINFPA